MISTIKLRGLICALLEKKGLTDKLYVDTLDYVIELFKSRHLGEKYYGYHNINHELSVTYIALLASTGKGFERYFSKSDIKHLYFAALLHDFDPQKNVDKPHEEEVIRYLKADKNLRGWMKEANVDENIVSLLILRTSYPWPKEKTHILYRKIDNFFAKSRFSHNPRIKSHFVKLGRYLSVSDRIGAYALVNFLDALEMIKKNAHSLGWDPETMIKRSILYFEELYNLDEDYTDSIIQSLPIKMRMSFMKNIRQIFQLRAKELQIRSSLVYNKLNLIPTFEKKQISEKTSKTLWSIFEELPDPLQFNKNKFLESLYNPDTVLVTLRKQSEVGQVIGFAKGGSIEDYQISKEISDKNFGKRRTVFLEPVALKMGYWGQGGSYKLRSLFREIAKQKGYQFLASFEHRELIQARILNKEKIKFLQKFNPQRFDYYRIKL